MTFRILIARLLLLPLMLASLASCMKQPGDDPGPRHKWFNPYGQEQEDVIPDQCPPDAQVPPPGDPPPPPAGTAPKDWHSVTYHLNIDSRKWIRNEAIIDYEYCIPVSIYVYITADGLAGQVIETRDYGVNKYTSPWNGLRTTPWRASVVVSWEPTRRRPVMNIELSAKYEIGEGLSRAPAPTDGTVGLSCSIRQNEVPLALQNSLDIFGPPSGPGPNAMDVVTTGPFVRCKPQAFQAVPM